MALTQMQLIQSLGEAMSWFERELNWGVPATELRHLIGRMGELYAALITNGQMATEVNQAGYDVVSNAGERISVKTTAIMATNGHISFNESTLGLVDRIIILRVNVEDMQIETLFDGATNEAKELMACANDSNTRTISLSKFTKKKQTDRTLSRVQEAKYSNYVIVELENGTIEIYHNGLIVTPTKPALREIAKDLSIPLVNSNGNTHTTRQLGTLIIRSLSAEH